MKGCEPWPKEMNRTQKGIKGQVYSQITWKIIQLYILLHSKRKEEDVV